MYSTGIAPLNACLSLLVVNTSITRLPCQGGGACLQPFPGLGLNQSMCVSGGYPSLSGQPSLSQGCFIRSRFLELSHNLDMGWGDDQTLFHLLAHQPLGSQTAIERERGCPDSPCRQPRIMPRSHPTCGVRKNWRNLSHCPPPPCGRPVVVGAPRL